MVRRLVERLCFVVVAVVEEEGVFLVLLSFLKVLLVCLGKHQVASVPYVAGLRVFLFRRLVPQYSGVVKVVVLMLGVGLPVLLLLVPLLLVPLQLVQLLAVLGEELLAVGVVLYCVRLLSLCQGLLVGEECLNCMVWTLLVLGLGKKGQALAPVLVSVLWSVRRSCQT